MPTKIDRLMAEVAERKAVLEVLRELEGYITAIATATKLSETERLEAIRERIKNDIDYRVRGLAVAGEILTNELLRVRWEGVKS